jgi:hypothetical protein
VRTSASPPIPTAAASPAVGGSHAVDVPHSPPRPEPSVSPSSTTEV